MAEGRVNVDVESRANTAGIDTARRKIEELGKTASKASGGAKKLAVTTTEVRDAASGLSRSMPQLGGWISSIATKFSAAGAAAGFAFSQFIEAIKSIRNMGAATAEFAEATKRIGTLADVQERMALASEHSAKAMEQWSLAMDLAMQRMEAMNKQLDLQAQRREQIAKLQDQRKLAEINRAVAAKLITKEEGERLKLAVKESAIKRGVAAEALAHANELINQRRKAQEMLKQEQQIQAAIQKINERIALREASRDQALKGAQLGRSVLEADRSTLYRKIVDLFDPFGRAKREAPERSIVAGSEAIAKAREQELQRLKAERAERIARLKSLRSQRSKLMLDVSIGEQGLPADAEYYRSKRDIEIETLRAQSDAQQITLQQQSAASAQHATDKRLDGMLRSASRLQGSSGQLERSSAAMDGAARAMTRASAHILDVERRLRQIEQQFRASRGYQ